MSRLLQMLEKIGKGATTPLGFGAANRTQKVAPMLLVGFVQDSAKEGVSLLTDAGIETVALDGVEVQSLGLPEEIIKKLTWGVAISKLDSSSSRNLMEKGADFFLFNAEKASVEALEDEDDEVGYFLRIEPDVEDRVLRAIEELPVDGVVLGRGQLESPVTLRHLMQIGAVRTMFSKYLLLEVPSSLSAKEVEALYNAGVDGLVINVAGATKKQLKSLKEAAESLPAKQPPKGSRIVPVLPRSAHSSFSPASPRRDDDDDDDDDDEP